MKAIQITRLQATIVVMFAVLAGMWSPMARRELTLLLQGEGGPAVTALNPNVGAGFKLIGVATAGCFLLAWACFVAANRQSQRGRASCKRWFVSLPVMSACSA